MENMFKLESPKFDGTNCNIQKDKMKTHLLCIGLTYWLIAKASKDIVEEDELESYIEEQREVFMCNIRAREVVLLALPKSEYSQVKLLKTSHEIWKALEANYEGDKHAKRVRLQNLICAFQEARMMEDESVRNYIGRISEIFAGIKSHGGTKSDDEVIWKILKSLTPPFKKIKQMIQLMILYTENFTKEILLGRLEAAKFDLKQ